MKNRLVKKAYFTLYFLLYFACCFSELAASERIDNSKPLTAVSVPTHSLPHDPRATKNSEVLPPWTPLVYSNTMDVSCWNRQYDVSRGPLPTIVSAGKQLFAKRPSVRLTIAGNGFIVDGKNIFVEKGSAVARLEGRMKLPRGVARWKSELHYDGWFQIAFQLDPVDGPFKIEALYIDLPLKSEHATQLGASQWTAWNGQSWSTVLDSHTRRGRHQQPCFWLGDFQRGVAWIGMSDANFSRRRGDNVIIKRKNDRTNLEIQICQRAITVERSLEYVFGVQATPVRPPSPGARDFVLKVDGERHVYGFGGTWWETGKPIEVFPQQRELRSWKNAAHRYPRGLFPYLAVYAVGNDADVFTIKSQLWINSKPVRERICAGSDPWKEWLLKWAKECLLYPEVGGIYLDVCHVKKCNSPHHGHQIVDTLGRKIKARWNVLEQRELHQALYALCTAHDKKLILHAHTRWWPCVHGWGHFLVAGEDTYWQVNGDRNVKTSDRPWAYVDSLDLRYWRTLHRMGSSVLFLPQFGRASPKSDLYLPQPSRSVLGLIGVHGLGLYASKTNRTERDRLYFDLLKPWANADFHSYWESREYAHFPLLTSYFERSSGERMVVHFNPTDRSVTVDGQTVPARDYLLVRKRETNR